LTVYEGSNLDPVQQPGPFLPGNIPADVAGVIPNFLGVNIYGAVTDLIAGLGPISTTVANNGTFTLTDLPLSVTSGTLFYEGGFLLPLSSTSLTGNNATYTVAGSLVQSGNLVTGVNLPVGGSFTVSTTIAELNNLQLDIALTLTGNVIASASNAPDVAVLGPNQVVRGEEASYNLLAFDDSVPSGGTFTYEVDWNNDNVVDQVINGGASVTTTHAFDTNGSKTYKFRVTDNSANVSAWRTDTVNVSTYRTAPNPNNGSLTDLYIGGLTTDDFIILGRGDDLGPPYDADDVFFFNGNSNEGLIVVPNITGRVITYLQDGDDIFNPTTISNSTVQYGGNGNDVLFGTVQSDTLEGGAGDDILVGSLDGSAAPDLMNGGDGSDFFLADAGGDTINGGNDDDIVLAGDGSNVVDGGAGNDAIVGGEGTDSLLGGTGLDFILGLGGSDTLRGGGGQDFIVAGYIDDTPEGTAEGVVGEWFFGGSYTSRVNNITGVTNTGLNPYPLVVGVTVFDDGAADTIFGDADEDFFYLDLATDIAADVAVGEVVVDV
jgi:Ca2+-binding RTX toxin-like protein